MRTQNLGHDHERSLAAHQRARQIESDRILGRPAEANDRSVGGHRLDAQRVVHGDAVFERVRSAGVRGHVAADGASALARGIGSVVIAGPFQRVGQPDIDHARLDHGIAIAQVDLQDALHPRHHDHHAAADRQAATGQASARAARQKRHVGHVADLHDRGHVLGRARKDHHIRAVLFDHEPVAFVDHQVRMRSQHVVVADSTAQLVGNREQSGRNHQPDTQARKRGGSETPIIAQGANHPLAA